ncbi:response regulator receiver modulated diguanylate cyclase [Methylophaga lonarensis MPL]|uniref:diguanylate cyclase n=1 Tax=Methylophaga lonarensis MPL TaxID=1286106 RepID=M7NZ02_9GAMM|nr:GGDEF domain-containing protein [Methylophaga lonarensis]EMR12441.1 response regulator receiver modulated diguanylate cyclase [Methylophaga lonarensis MPL]
MSQHIFNEQQGGLQLVSSTNRYIDSVQPSDTPDPELIQARLPMILQTSLDIVQIIHLFDHEVRALIGYQGLSYKHPALTEKLEIGSKRHHRCHYQLEVDQVNIGELELTRNKKFSAAEIELIEDLLCKLVYPLRNCTLYQKALSASVTDMLSGLYNRQAFDQGLMREIELAKRQQAPFSLLIIDIDNFKQINDALGHAAGDQAIRSMGDLLKSMLRQTDSAYRFGGEEFTLLLSHTEHEDAMMVAERLRQSIAELKCVNGESSFGFTVSIGVAGYCKSDNASSIFKRADRALYQAKHSGKNTISSDLASH